MTEENDHEIKNHRRSTCAVHFSSPFAVAAFPVLSAFVSQAQTQSKPSAPAASAPAQKTFDTPQQAADALIQAAESFDVPALLEIFGPEGKDFVSSADPVQDKNNAEAFAAKARKKNVGQRRPEEPGPSNSSGWQ